jgi:hypothetical protein
MPRPPQPRRPDGPRRRRSRRPSVAQTRARTAAGTRRPGNRCRYRVAARAGWLPGAIEPLPGCRRGTALRAGLRAAKPAARVVVRTAWIPPGGAPPTPPPARGIAGNRRPTPVWSLLGSDVFGIVGRAWWNGFIVVGVGQQVCDFPFSGSLVKMGIRGEGRL